MDRNTGEFRRRFRRIFLWRTAAAILLSWCIYTGITEEGGAWTILVAPLLCTIPFVLSARIRTGPRTASAQHSPAHVPACSVGTECRTLFTRIPDAVFFVDRETGRLLDFNPAALERYGYSESELRSMYLWDLHPAEDQAEIRTLLDNCGIEKDRTCCQRTRDGRLIWADMRASGIPYQGRPAWLTMLHDVTVSKHAENALRLTQFAVEHARDAVFWMDRNARIVNVNQAACSSLGYSRKQLLTMDVFDIDPSYSRPLWEQCWEARRDEKNLILESRHRRSDGSEFPVEVTATFLTFEDQELDCTFVRDITERKRAEDALRLTQFTVDRAQDAVFWIDCDARFVYINEEACRSLGYSREELLNMTVFDIDPDFTPQMWGPFWERGLREKPILLESNHRRRDGSVFPVEVFANFLEFEGRVLDCAFVRDTSERLRTRQALEAHAREMEQKNAELSAALTAAREATGLKSMFLANMSHEIRTPMNGVLGMLALALDSASSPDQREYLQTARDSAESMLALLGDILDLSRIEAGRLELDTREFRPADVVAEVVRLFSLRASRKELELNYCIDAEVTNSVRGDSARLRQVLMNLVDNALKFTHTGRVQVSVTQQSGSDGNCELLFSVSDTGIGIPPDKHGKIFEAFQQADGSATRRFGGSGLGLTISANLVQLMSGTIWVESAVGEGSTFRFTARFGLPAASSCTEREAPEPEAPARTLDILVVEDNPVNQRVLTRMLGNQGHTVVLAEDGLRAVSEAKRRRFDLILMDVQMPELDGIAATRLIRDSEEDRRVPIVAVTAHVMKEDLARCLEAGMDGYLSKPVKPSELTRVIQGIASMPVSPEPAADQNA